MQLPLDSENPIDSALATNAVSPEKDVDGYPFYACVLFKNVQLFMKMNLSSISQLIGKKNYESV